MSTDPTSFRMTHEDSTAYPKQYDHIKLIAVVWFLIDSQEYGRIRKERPEFLAWPPNREPRPSWSHHTGRNAEVDDESGITILSCSGGRVDHRKQTCFMKVRTHNLMMILKYAYKGSLAVSPSLSSRAGATPKQQR